MAKSALITGITGQDGSYLAELLLEKGYNVYGLIRRLSTPNISRIEHILPYIEMVEGDLIDQSSMTNTIQKIQPDEVYNLAAQSFVSTSWDHPILTGDVTGLGVVRVLEAVRHSCPDARVYQASSSEMFGKVMKPHKTRKPNFIHVVLMDLQRSMVTGLVLITGKNMICIYQMEFCLIMNPPDVGLSL